MQPAGLHLLLHGAASRNSGAAPSNRHILCCIRINARATFPSSFQALSVLEKSTRLGVHIAPHPPASRGPRWGGGKGINGRSQHLYFSVRMDRCILPALPLRSCYFTLHSSPITSLLRILSLFLSPLSLSLSFLSLSYPSPSRLPTPLSLPLPPSLFLSGSLSLPLSQLFSIFVHMNLGTLLALGFPDTRDYYRRS